jgi:uncharacterized delta-60 repeat protein
MNHRRLFLVASAVVAVVAMLCFVGTRQPAPRERQPAEPSITRLDAAPSAASPNNVAGPKMDAATPSWPRVAPMARTPAHAAFADWAAGYLVAPAARRVDLLAGAEDLARARHAEMLDLVQKEPRRALAQALPFRLRQGLPPALQPYLEQRVSGRGNLEAVLSTPLPGRREPAPEYRVVFSNQVFKACLYGRHARWPQRRDVPLHGIALAADPANPHYRLMAVAEEPLRVLEPDEARARLAEAGQSAPNTPAGCVADLGGELLTFANHSQALILNQELMAADSDTPGVPPPLVMTAGSSNLPPRLGGTQGPKRLLMAPVTFVDEPRPPVTADNVQAVGRNNNQYMVDNSYNTISFNTTVTPTFRLPQAKYYYGEFLGALRSDAFRLAADAGYNLSEFDYAYVIFPSIPGVGFGGRSDGLLQGGAGAITHELGHNLGLGHASYWDTRGNDPLPDQPRPPQPPYPFDLGSLVGHEDINAPYVMYDEVPIEEYGNIHDVMGSGGGHFSAAFKYSLNWLQDDFIRVLERSATNRLYPFDLPGISTGRVYAVVFRKDHEQTYWLTHREGFASNPWQLNGVEVQWQGMLLDTTPGTISGKQDAAVVVGRTFHDPQVGVFVTPLAKGGGPDPRDRWVDVVVQFGPFPSNRPPTLALTASALRVAPGTTVTFTATATDPDGDALAYYWDWGDQTFGSNAPVNLRTFTAEGQYVVRCEVSDLKGGVVSDHQVVIVGNPATLMMSGRVLDVNGRPLAGVRVHNCGSADGNYRVGFTDSQGRYTIGNIPPGTYTNRAFLYGYRTEPAAFFDPIVLTSRDATNLNHLATPLTRVTVTRTQDAQEAGTPGIFTVRRTGDLTRDLPVAYVLSGTASAGTHYDAELLTNMVIIPAGADATELRVPPLQDTVGDGPETVIVNLIHNTNDIRIVTLLTNVLTTNGTVVVTNTDFYYVTNDVLIPGWELIPYGPDERLHWTQTDPRYVMDLSEARLAIVDDDPPQRPSVTLSVVDGVATELNNDPGIVMFTRVGGTTESNLVVRLSISGTASPEDHFPPPAAVTIPAGARSVRLAVYARDDQLVEDVETIVVRVEPDPAYEAGPGTATIRIADDDLPVVSLYATDSMASKLGTDSGRVTVSRAGNLSRELVVYYVAGGTALAGTDYQRLSGTVVIPAGAITADIAVTPIARPTDPGFKTIEVILSDAPTYNIHVQHSATVWLQPDLPVLTVSASAGTIGEAAGTANFVITRTGGTADSLVVRYLTGGFGAQQYDFSALGDTAVIPAGAASVNVPLNTINDRFRERGDLITQDSAILQLVATPDYLLGNPSSAQILITDDDSQELPAVEFMWHESVVREDDGGVTIPVRISANPTTNRQPVIVEYRITGGSAVPGLNYRPLTNGFGLLTYMNVDPSPVEVPPLHEIEASIKLINIPIFDDGLATGDLNFTVQLFLHHGYLTNRVTVTNAGEVFTNVVLVPVPTNAYIGNYRSHTVTITDVGATVVGVEATQPYALEDGVPGVLTFTRTGGDLNQALTIRYAVSGTASSDTDFIPLPGTLTFPPGSNQVTVLLQAVDDPEEEAAESVIVTVLRQPGLRVGGSATLILVDNDRALEFTSPLFTVSEAATEAVITVRRAGNINVPVTVDYLVLEGTATRGADWLATNGTLRFAPGETLQSFVIPLLPDTLVEGDETVSLVLTNPTGGIPLGGQRTATLVIVDDDLGLAFAQPVFATNENAGTAFVTVRRAGLTNGPVTVRFTTFGDTATGGVDYHDTNVLLLFAAGELSKTLAVPLLDDALFEGDERVRLQLSEPGPGAQLGALSNATLVIVDDECAIGFGQATFSAKEYSPAALVEVRRFGGTLHPVSVDFATADGTATSSGAGRDFLATSGTLAFAGDAWVRLPDGSGSLVFQAGETNKTLLIELYDDAEGEGNETFQVRLSRVQGPPVGARPGSIILGATNLAGTTNLIGGPVIASVAILDDEMPGEVDHRFNPLAGPDARVLGLALQADGRVAFGGEFLSVNGIQLARLGRLQTDGYLDFAFNPGAGADATVQALATTPDGKLYAGGNFTRADNVTRTRVARFNANGELDLAFDPAAGANGLVRALAVDDEGRALLGGDFTQVRGQTRNRLARLLSSGLLDTNFNPNVNNSVNALALQPDGRILLGGAFSSIGGVGRSGIGRLQTNGALDATFTVGTGANGAVHSLALQPNGKVVLGGAFSVFNSQAYRSLVRLETNGVVDFTLQIGAGANGPIYAVALDGAGRLLVAGDFTTFGDFSRIRIARLLADGSVDTTFDPGTGANAAVRALVAQPDSAVVLGGEFTEVNGLPRVRLARLHGDERLADLLIRLSGLSVTPTQAQFTLEGSVGKTYVVEFTGSLRPPVAWTPFGTNTLVAPTTSVTDRSVSGTSQRFYRARKVGP